jgi:hypothetical protein
MPLKKSKSRSKKAVQKAISYNMHELKHAAKKRPYKQRVAIALRAAGVSKKQKK